MCIHGKELPLPRERTEVAAQRVQRIEPQGKESSGEICAPHQSESLNLRAGGLSSHSLLWSSILLRPCPGISERHFPHCLYFFSNARVLAQALSVSQLAQLSVSTELYLRDFQREECVMLLVLPSLMN